jgi:hypothetical protein
MTKPQDLAVALACSNICRRVRLREDNDMSCWTKVAVGFAAVLAMGRQATAEDGAIGLHNYMASPIAIKLVSTFDGSVTNLRLGRHQTINFSFRDDEFDVRVVPLDHSDTVFYLGRLPFRDLAGRLGAMPLVLRGDFQTELDLYGHACQTRVAVHLDMVLGGQWHRLTALAPGYVIAQRPVAYSAPLLVR